MRQFFNHIQRLNTMRSACVSSLIWSRKDNDWRLVLLPVLAVVKPIDRARGSPRMSYCVCKHQSNTLHQVLDSIGLQK